MPGRLLSLFLCVIFLGVGSETYLRAEPATRSILDNVGVINFTSSSKFALGDTVAIFNMAAPKERCIEFDEKTVRKDTDGAVSSAMSLYLISDYGEFESQMNYSFSMQASGGIDVAKAFAGNASGSLSSHIEKFIRNEKRSLLVVLEASADQGRDYISNYALKEAYQKLLTSNKKDFVAACGTHFIRAVARKSRLRIVFNLSNLNQSSKDTITGSFTSSVGGKATIKAITADAKASFAADLSSTLKLASQLGRISYEIQSAGGASISSLGKALKGANLGNLADSRTILEAFADAASDFTASNSAPDYFILVPYPQLTSTDMNFDQRRFDALGDIYKALLRVDAQLSTYEAYKTRNAALWEKYFRVYHEKLAALRSSLVKQFLDCREQSQCNFTIPKKLDGALLDDVLYGGRFGATCPLGNEVELSLNSSTKKTVRYISSIVLQWSGNIRYLDDIDMLGLELYRVTTDLDFVRLPIEVDRQFRSRINDDGTVSAYVTVHRHEIAPAQAVKGKDMDYNYLDAMRAEAARSLYVARFRTTSGIQVEEVLGYPNMKGCKVLEEDL